MVACFSNQIYRDCAEYPVSSSFTRVDSVANSPLKTAAPWSQPMDDWLIDTSDHIADEDKLPLRVRVSLILGGALLGWALPIALAERFL